MKKLAIIPARGGSKRIPGKNIRAFLGKPIIAYSIEAAMESGLFDEVMVSTDDDAIAAVAVEYGAKVPFMRSEAASGDFSTLADVISEVLSYYRDRGEEFSAFCSILATAPTVSVELLKEGLRIMEEGGFDSIFPVARFSYPIQRSLQMESTGRVSMVWPEYALARSQDLEPRYHDSGQFYWMRCREFERQGRLFAANSGAIVLPDSHVQDIDTDEDWAMAELKYRMLHGI